jgi:hypothetical protein
MLFVCRRLPANEKNTHLCALCASVVRSICRKAFNKLYVIVFMKLCTKEYPAAFSAALPPIASHSGDAGGSAVNPTIFLSGYIERASTRNVGAVFNREIVCCG